MRRRSFKVSQNRWSERGISSANSLRSGTADGIHFALQIFSNPAALRRLALLLMVVALTGCAHVSSKPPLASMLVSLSPTVSPPEAQQIETTAQNTSQRLVSEYRLAKPPWFHNLLVNLGLRERGLCYQFAEDLAADLKKLDLATLELRWGISRPGKWREHNVIVVTATNQPFEEGIVLDAWRNSGRLYWTPVKSDRRHKWEEGALEPNPPSAGD